MRYPVHASVYKTDSVVFLSVSFFIVNSYFLNPLDWGNSPHIKEYSVLGRPSSEYSIMGR